MKKLLFFVALATCMTLQAKVVKVASPNGRITVSISDSSGALSYSAALGSKTLFTQHTLQVKLATKTLGEKAKIAGVKTQKVNNIIKPVVPIKQSTINDRYTDALLTMRGNYKVEFRVFDNAVAYRFIIAEKDSVNIVDETFDLQPSEEMAVHYQPASDWGTDSESPYIHCMLKEWKNDQDMSVLPLVLSSTKDDLHLLISESDLRDYSALFLRGNGTKDCLSIRGAHCRQALAALALCSHKRLERYSRADAHISARRKKRNRRHKLDKARTGVVGLVEPQVDIRT